MVGTVNANHEHFEAGVRDMAIAQTEFPGWFERLPTPVSGLDNRRETFGYVGAPGVIKVFLEIRPLDSSIR